MPAFIRDFGLTGIPMSFFHSVSAFCNAGFDLMGNYSSLTRYAGDPLVTVPVMLLIILGGLGFLTYKDVLKYRFRIKKYTLQSKVALSATGILLLGGAVFFFFAETSLEKMPDTATHIITISSFLIFFTICLQRYGKKTNLKPFCLFFLSFLLNISPQFYHPRVIIQ